MAVSQGRLVEVEAVEQWVVEPPRAAGLDGTKTFRAYDQAQPFLLPPSLTDWLPAGHLARTIDALVEDTLDLTPILASYVGEWGYPPYDPRLMLKVLLYGYATRITSSRKLAAACEADVAMRFLAVNQTPDDRSIAKFRKQQLGAFAELFVQVLQIAARAGMVILSQVALDGSKVRANASRHKAMSYARMGPLQAVIPNSDRGPQGGFR